MPAGATHLHVRVASVPAAGQRRSSGSGNPAGRRSGPRRRTRAAMSSSFCTSQGTNEPRRVRSVRRRTRRSLDGLGKWVKRQFGSLGLERLAHRPGDAAVVGHAHHQADFAAEKSHTCEAASGSVNGGQAHPQTNPYIPKSLDPRTPTPPPAPGRPEMAYSSIAAMSPAKTCSQFIRSSGISRSMKRRATRFFRSLLDPLLQEQVADDHGNGRIDQPAAGKVQVGRGLAS